jgi:hypothetical protein
MIDYGSRWPMAISRYKLNVLDKLAKHTPLFHRFPKHNFRFSFVKTEDINKIVGHTCHVRLSHSPWLFLIYTCLCTLVYLPRLSPKELGSVGSTGQTIHFRSN